MNATESEHYLLCYGCHLSFCKFALGWHQVIDEQKSFEPCKAHNVKKCPNLIKDFLNLFS